MCLNDTKKHNAALTTDLHLFKQIKTRQGERRMFFTYDAHIIFSTVLPHARQELYSFGVMPVSICSSALELGFSVLAQ